MSADGAAPAAEPPLRVAVRELCEFTAKHGDLDRRFTPAPSAREGIEGHRLVAARRGAGYRRELALESWHHGLHLHGRADGLQTEPLRLEEIKTHRGPIARVPDNQRALHFAQLRIYGAQLCRARGLAELDLRLVYLDVDSGAESRLDERRGAIELDQIHDDAAGRFLAWARAQAAHREARDAALSALAFPHAAFHAGQRQLSEAVYRSAARGRSLLAQAPTGIGKSVGTLFPALKAMARGHLDRIFYLTAKTSGRRSALDALAALRGERALPLRVLELVARDKACEHPGSACHGEACPLARGFYDRLPAARAAALAGNRLDQAEVRAVALAHRVCPYYLAQELARWSDVVVGDYNYYFDRSALLHGLTALNGWRVALLIDEAHNLVDRGRAMYSAELDPRTLAAARKAAPPALRRPLDRLRRTWKAVAAQLEGEYGELPGPPAALIEAAGNAGAALAEHFAAQPAGAEAALQTLHFALLNFAGLAESFGEHSICELLRVDSPGRGIDARIGIRNLVPAPFLAPRFAAAASTIAFSATLRPETYYRDLLGLPAAAISLDVPSPFAAGQLEVRIARGVSTRWRDRAASVAPIARLIAEQYRARPGNYLAFFSSFDYLRQVAARLAAERPEVPQWQQQAAMSEADRGGFVERFADRGRGVGFAVLGGVFAEGIDLPGERLIGAFVVTLGLPQLNPVNEATCARMESLFGAGQDYTYLFPGLRKVVQAAGRVIRSRDDRGVLWLIDDRYRQPRVQRLLPAWWPEPLAVACGAAPIA